MRSLVVCLFLFLTFVSLCQNEAASSADFSALKDYEIVAFGEASHGSSSDYVAREKLIADLVESSDSLDVFVEMPFYAGIAIKHYAAGKIDSAALLQELRYYGLCSDGFLHLINRFKDDKRIAFYGLDMQTHESSLKLLKESLTELFPQLKNEIAAYTDSLNHDFLFEYSNAAYSSYRGSIHHSVEELGRIIASGDSMLRNRFMEIQLPFAIVRQYIGLMDGYKLQTKKHPFRYDLYRDSCMAENVCSIKAYSGRKAVLFGANSHVYKYGTPPYIYMGGRLRQRFGNRYFVIGSQYVVGTLREAEPLNGKWATSVNTLRPIRRTLPYDLDKLLEPEHDTLIFIAGSEGKLRKVFYTKSHFQNFGAARYNDKRSSYTIGKPEEFFDAIYLIPRCEASVYLKD